MSLFTVGINNLLSSQERWYLPPSSLTLTGKTLESLAREPTSPCLSGFSSPSVPLRSPSVRWIMNRMEPQAQLSRQHPPRQNVAPRRKPSSNLLYNIFPSGVVFGDQPTCLPNSIWSQLEQKMRLWQRAYWRPLETQQTTETETRSTLATLHSCT